MGGSSQDGQEWVQPLGDGTLKSTISWMDCWNKLIFSCWYKFRKDKCWFKNY